MPSCRIVDRIQSHWIQPRGKLDLDEEPPRLVFFPFAFAVAFFARSKATIFSFPIAAGGSRTEQRCREQKRMRWR